MTGKVSEMVAYLIILSAFPLFPIVLNIYSHTEGLLLLTQLSQSNQEIQKIVAFEGAFERLFHIIDAEVY